MNWIGDGPAVVVDSLEMESSMGRSSVRTAAVALDYLVLFASVSLLSSERLHIVCVAVSSASNIYANVSMFGCS